jgi:flagellar biosynthetic protein FlhB
VASTEQKLPPSAKRLKDAREKGDIPSSRELSSALGLLAVIGVLAGTGAVVTMRLMSHVGEALRRLGDRGIRDIAPADLMPFITAGGALIAVTAGPIALAGLATSLGTSLAQTKLNWSTQALGAKWDRLSPSHGMQKFAPSQAGIELVKAVIVAAILSFMAWRATQTLMIDAPRMTLGNPVRSAEHGWDEAKRFLWQAGILMLAVGVVDYGVQKYRFGKRQGMTRQEHVQEQKQDSNPEIKGRIRRIQREQHKKRMLKAAAKATVIITNPTHFAVALEYNRDKSPAPIVVAKGADRVAAKIREIGRLNSIPIMENPPLARALFKECEVGDTIPGPLFGAVAEILAYLIRIKQLTL